MHLSKCSVRRLAEDPTVGDQAGESAELEDVRTLWFILAEHGQRWKEVAVKSSPFLCRRLE